MVWFVSVSADFVTDGDSRGQNSGVLLLLTSGGFGTCTSLATSRLSTSAGFRTSSAWLFSGGTCSGFLSGWGAGSSTFRFPCEFFLPIDRFLVLHVNSIEVGTTLSRSHMSTDPVTVLLSGTTFWELDGDGSTFTTFAVFLTKLLLEFLLSFLVII